MKMEKIATVARCSARPSAPGEISEEIIRMTRNSDAKWFDARGQGGPLPSDFGDHRPIDIESVVVGVCVAKESINIEANEQEDLDDLCDH